MPLPHFQIAEFKWVDPDDPDNVAVTQSAVRVVDLLPEGLAAFADAMATDILKTLESAGYNGGAPFRVAIAALVGDAFDDAVDPDDKVLEASLDGDLQAPPETVAG